MLNTKKVIELKKIINLKALCEASGLSYNAIFKRLKRGNSLREYELNRMNEGLEKYNLKYISQKVPKSSFLD